MEAPTGHRFCVIRAQTPDFDAKAETWEDWRVIYREAGDFKTSYAADGADLPDRASTAGPTTRLVAVAFLVVPLVITPYWSNAILLPFLIWSIAAIGLNILTGYCGQLSASAPAASWRSAPSPPSS